jgi:hypothetical protein
MHLGSGDVAVSNSTLYLTNYYSGLQVIDVHDPATPAIVATMNTPGDAGGVAILDSYIYVADNDSGLVVYPSRCSAPEPVILSSFQASTQGASILIEWTTSSESGFAGFRVQRSVNQNAGYKTLNEDLIASPSPYQFLDDEVKPGETYYYRLEAVDRSGHREFFGPTSARVAETTLRSMLGQSWPNPFSGNAVTIPIVLAASGRVTLRILDASGRQVRQLLDERQDLGSREVFWDGRDDRGRLVPAGMYVYELQGPGIHWSRRMVRLR